MKNSGVDWKSKYVSIRNMMKENLDVAWRMGYEQGAKDAQQDAMQQQMQQQQEQMQQQQGQAQQVMDAQAQGHQQGAQAASDGQTQGADTQSQGQLQGQAQGDEVGQAIDELESIVNKYEGNPEMLEELHKSMNKVRDSHKVRSLSFMMNASDKEAKEVGHQESIVQSCLDSWQKEEEKALEHAKATLDKYGSR